MKNSILARLFFGVATVVGSSNYLLADEPPKIGSEISARAPDVISEIELPALEGKIKALVHDVQDGKGPEKWSTALLSVCATKYKDPRLVQAVHENIKPLFKEKDHRTRVFVALFSTMLLEFNSEKHDLTKQLDELIVVLSVSLKEDESHEVRGACAIALGDIMNSSYANRLSDKNRGKCYEVLTGALKDADSYVAYNVLAGLQKKYATHDRALDTIIAVRPLLEGSSSLVFDVANKLLLHIQKENPALVIPDPDERAPTVIQAPAP